MKKVFQIVIFILISVMGYPQGVIVTDDATSSPDASAIIEMKSTSKGFLPPRLTLDQINAIGSPQEGMMVYNLTKKKPVYYNGTEWTDLLGGSISADPEIGDYYQGGIIFYLDGLGGGYIAAIADVDDGGDFTVDWGCSGTTTGATSLSDGETNTTTILGACATANIAADLCDDYENDGYTDWYLPAIDQLDSMYVYKTLIGGFSNSEDYHSSTELSGTTISTLSFFSGAEFTGFKTTFQYRVRPVRTF